MMKKVFTLTIAIAMMITSVIAQTARVQVIHNSADAAASVVDVWLDDAPLIDDFAFRTASPFIDAPAGVNFDITIQPSSSTDTTNGLWRKTYHLEAHKTYVLVANGIVSSSGYSPATPFDIYVNDMGLEEAGTAGNSDVLVFHGATDAPTVDVYEPYAGLRAVDDMSYGEFQGYLELANADYSLQVQTEDGRTAVAEYAAPLETLGLSDSALIVLASGFLNPANNSDGEAFGLYVALPMGGALIPLPSVDVASARVQVIHNSADAAAATVDVWYNDIALIDDFAFRTASPFIDVTAGTEFDITIQPASSTDTTSGLWRKSYTLMGDETYVLIANGIVSGSGYAPATPFDIYVNAMGREMAGTSGNSDVLVFHGATDAPGVDVYEPYAGIRLVNNMLYGSFQGYLELATADYSLQVQTADGRTAVAEYGAPLQTLGLSDSALIVVASGFLNPANNSDGAAFGLYAALPSGGDLVALPSQDIAMARVQVIHNAADAAAEMVDVWYNDTPLLDDFAFRTASPFVDVTAGTVFDITIQPPSSMDTTNGLWRKHYSLLGDKTYILVANGIVSASGYSPATPFDIFVNDMGREMAGIAGNSDVLVFHGATDAPTVDVYEPYAGLRAVDDMAYGEFQGYLELANADYSLQVQTEDGRTAVAEYAAPLETLGLSDSALIVVASGFLNPANNSDGEAFGLYVALPMGGALIPLPTVDVASARVQVIHNSADAAAATVDVWYNDMALLPGFEFRTASPFIDVAAGTEFDITIQPPSSSDTTSGLWRKSYTLMGDMTYVLIANGIVSGSGYDPATAFDIYVNAMGREEAGTAGNTDILVFHGATDAPTVDIYEATAGELIDDLSYGEYDDDYLELPAADYTLQVRDETGASIVASYSAPLATLSLSDSALVAVASGFLNPVNNSDGAAFGIWVALPMGGNLIELPSVATSTNDLLSQQVDLKIWPVPASRDLNVSFTLDEASEIRLDILNIAGQTVKSRDLGPRGIGSYTETIDVSSFQEGIYLMRFRSGNSFSTSKLKVVR